MNTNVIKKEFDGMTLIFSSKEAEKDFYKIKEQIRSRIKEIKKEPLNLSIIKLNDNNLCRTVDSGHNLHWKNYYVEVHKTGNDFTKIYKYQFGFCIDFDCDYTKLRLISTRIIYAVEQE